MNTRYLRRYTDLPALIYLLTKKQITLLDPESWDDKNDSRYLQLYRERRKLKIVLALCFTQANETYHHWRVFGSGSGGVCISFKRSALLQALKKEPGVRAEEVKYLKLPEIRRKKAAIQDLPFLKRYPFEGENEFRVIYESQTARRPKLDIPVPLSCIYKITLSPWLHLVLSRDVKRMLRSIEGCAGLKIRRSTLISNEEWKRLGEAASVSESTI